MKHPLPCLLLLLQLLACSTRAEDSTNMDWKKYVPIIKQTLSKDYKNMFREKGGALEYPFIVPGSAQYNDVLWDWDSWLTNIALRQILLESGTEKDRAAAVAYEQGCILNFLSSGHGDGWMPIFMGRKPVNRPKDIYSENMHKPVLAQHAAFLVKLNNGNAEWLREKFYPLQSFMHNYKAFHRNPATGLYFWQTDFAIGVDNDPSTFYRPARSSGSIYLNCLMYKELKAMVYLANCLNQADIAKEFDRDAEKLKAAIQEHCWDERDGFFLQRGFESPAHQRKAAGRRRLFRPARRQPARLRLPDPALRRLVGISCHVGRRRHAGPGEAHGRRALQRSKNFQRALRRQVPLEDGENV